MTIGERIKARRVELGLSQRALAAKMGYKNHTAITYVESGNTDLPHSRIKQFADALGVSMGYLMGWEENPEDVGALAAEVLKDPALLRLVDNFLKLSPADRETVGRLVASMAANKKD